MIQGYGENNSSYAGDIGTAGARGRKKSFPYPDLWNLDRINNYAEWPFCDTFGMLLFPVNFSGSGLDPGTGEFGFPIKSPRIGAEEACQSEGLV
jgi:hypothetical protein